MVPMKNNSQRYGVLTQLLHWSVAIIIITEISLVYIRDYIPETDPLNSLFIYIHKALGVVAIGLGILFVLYHLISIKPESVPGLSSIEKQLSLLARRLLLIMIIVMPISGFLMSIFNARPINMFLFVIPALETRDEFWGNLFALIHVYVSYLLIAVVALHIAAALRHHFWLHDNVLRRMLPVKLKKEFSN